MTAGTTIVLGAGATGLSAAFTLGSEATLVEREARVGGGCRSIVRDGFTFDHADHALFSSDDPYVKEVYRLLLGDNVHWLEREGSIGNGNGNGHGHGNGSGYAYGNGNGHRNGREPIARFGYPLRGGFQALMDGFLPRLKANLRLDTEAVRICPSKRSVRLSDGSTPAYDTLISTIPLPRLVRMLGPEAPPAVADAAAGLKHLSVRCVNLGVGRPGLTEKLWVHGLEGTVFHRIFVPGSASPHANPKGGFGLSCEITYSKDHPLPADGDELIERCVADCRRMGLIRAEDPIWTACQSNLPYGYVVDDEEREQRVDHIRAWLLERDVLLAGRFSEWEHGHSDHAFVAGRAAALRARQRREERRASRRGVRPQAQAELAPMSSGSARFPT